MQNPTPVVKINYKMSEFRGSEIRNEDTHFSVLNNYALQQLKLSYRSATNETSNILLKEVWNSNAKLFNDEAMSIIASSATELFKNTEICHNNWRSSISKEDAVTLFEKSIQDCTNCADLDFRTNDFGSFLKEECKCNLELPEKTEENVEPKTGNIFTKNFNSESSQESGDEKGFRPKFVRQRPANKAIETKYIKQSTLEVVDSHIKISKNKEDKDSLESWKPSPTTSKYTKEPAMVVDVDENNGNKSNFVKATFKTAKEQLLATNPAAKRTLGASRKAQGKFVSPMIGAQEKQETNEPIITDERLKNIDPKMIELIESEIIDKGTPISWEDIAGLQLAKSVIQEAVVWPLLRPDIFTGLRRPPKGILLFGPPGTGKTLIGKCVAAQCKATFFSISASSLTSKWIGDGEKMVRALFAVARCHQPAVIFIDEIDSLLTHRSDSEHEATRRIKTEFLVQFDGAAIGDEDRILIVGATNRPQELDEAARRRLVKRLYIPLPDVDARKQIITNLLKNEINELTNKDIDEVAGLTEGYSGADMKSLCSEAAMVPVRDLPLSQIATIHMDNVRPVCAQDFIQALQRVRPSVSQDDLGQYVKWNQTYGQGF